VGQGQPCQLLPEPAGPGVCGLPSAAKPFHDTVHPDGLARSAKEQRRAGLPPSGTVRGAPPPNGPHSPLARRGGSAGYALLAASAAACLWPSAGCEPFADVPDQVGGGFMVLFEALQQLPGVGTCSAIVFDDLDRF
jgi:hypothetical protein